jgi:hypothetical protein
VSSTQRSSSWPPPPGDESVNILPATIEAKAGATTGGAGVRARSPATTAPSPASRRPRRVPPTATFAGVRDWVSGAGPEETATRSGSWSANPASTGTRMAPSRSPFAPGTSEWR